MANRVASRLFVSRLSFYTTEKALENMFSPFGVVTRAELVMDPKTLRHKGFGFISFESAADAQKAIKALNNRIVDGRIIFVEVATSERPEEDTSCSKESMQVLTSLKK